MKRATTYNLAQKIFQKIGKVLRIRKKEGVKSSTKFKGDGVDLFTLKEVSLNIDDLNTFLFKSRQFIDKRLIETRGDSKIVLSDYRQHFQNELRHLVHPLKLKDGESCQFQSLPPQINNP